METVHVISQQNAVFRRLSLYIIAYKFTNYNSLVMMSNEKDTKAFNNNGGKVESWDNIYR